MMKKLVGKEIMKKMGVAPKKKETISADLKVTSFPIVGIGASAGGLEAIQDLLKCLSAKPEMAFVFIMHLSPKYKSMLTELLARTTKMQVSEVKNGMVIEINHVYVIPPNTNMCVTRGKLMLKRLKETGSKHMPIDCFFRSLAAEQGNKAIGVILSGTATDGTLGAEAIKADGGITFAQDEKTAKFSGMPQNAIVAGCVDFTLSPKDIASELERIAKHPFVSSAGNVEIDRLILAKDKGIEGIFGILRQAKGLDFTYYKPPTINRRIARRMVLLKLKRINDYTKFLRENKDEIDNLYEDLLINVTSFFRDPEVFDTLKKQVLPAMFKDKKKGQMTRVWVPGCSSGEEAYSIAICILETIRNKTSAFPVQIFATDVSENSITRARRGIYGKNIKDNITPERLKRFFAEEGNSYRVSKRLRDVCIFSKQNVFSDPPFSNIDLISCRNLLIYLQPVLQKKVFYNFHYAIRSSGFLLLGKSEAVGSYLNLFKALDGKKKIFTRRYLPFSPGHELVPKYYAPEKLRMIDIKQTQETDVGDIKNIESMVDRIVLSEYAPCGVLIDSNMQVVQFRGHTGRFLESAAGKPSLDVFKLAREGLVPSLRVAIYEARKTKNTTRREAVDVEHDGQRLRVNITVVPVSLPMPTGRQAAGRKTGTLKEEFFLAFFDEIGRAVASKNLPKARGKYGKDEKYVESLQKELSETKVYLQSVVEEQETANEEVKTANEEILSSNEELQSTNEELETSKEELQSTNEELITAHEEMQNRNVEISLLNDDLMNLLDSINMPVVVVGADLVIRRITLQCEKALNIIPSDVGRSISNIKHHIDIPELEKTFRAVIESLQSKTFEMKDKEKNWYSVYFKPYRTMDNKIDGVVAVFVDITERQKAQQMAQQIIEEARAYAENIVETVRMPLLVMDTDLKVVSANSAFYSTFKVGSKETKGHLIYDLGNRQWNIPKLRHLLEDVLPKNNVFENYEVIHNFETVGQKTMLLNGRRLGALQMILLAIEDITVLKKMEEERVKAVSAAAAAAEKARFETAEKYRKKLEKTNEELQREIMKRTQTEQELTRSNKVLEEFAYVTSHDLQEPLRTISSYIQLIERRQQGKFDAETNEFMAYVVDGAKCMATMINDVLSYSRVTTYGEPFKPTDLEAVLKTALSNCETTINESGAVITNDRLPTATVDASQFVHLFQNLIDNSIKFRSKEPPCIHIGSERKDDEWLFSVRDNGIGFEQKYAERLFQVFQRLHAKDKYPGTGIGLAICKKIVERHGGRIWVESEPKKGSTFYFTIPITPAKGGEKT